jgi:hypothetical protein
MINNNFCVFIITHGRPDQIKTYETLKNQGYTGKIYIVIDDLDKTIDKYKEIYKEKVIVFDKKEIAKKTDTGDNFNNLRTTTHARNACFEIAQGLNIDYFLVLDDDYKSFDWRFDDKFDYCHRKMGSVLDDIFNNILDFYISAKNVLSIAFAQGGDYIGGASSGICRGKGLVTMTRKCMNSFFCSISRPFKFISTLNEDVNTYLVLGKTGHIFLTFNQAALEQETTQKTAGGMTDSYLKYGTYVKSFYSVLYSPSNVTVRMMGFTNQRLHHHIKWNATTPKIISSNWRK